MSTPSDSPLTSLIAQDIDAGVRAAHEQRAKLPIQAAGPWQSHERSEAFTRMSELLLEALEVMRLVSQSFREGSPATRCKSADLQVHSHHRMERSATLRDRRAPCLSPPPEAIRQAESQMLDMFRGDQHRDGSHSERAAEPATIWGLPRKHESL